MEDRIRGGWNQFTIDQRKYLIQEFTKFFNRICGSPLYENDNFVFWSGNSIGAYLEKTSDIYPHYVNAEIKVENLFEVSKIRKSIDEIVSNTRKLDI